MKTRKLYEIRTIETGMMRSRSLSPKLRDGKRATKLKNYIAKRFKMEVFTNGLNIAAR